MGGSVRYKLDGLNHHISSSPPPSRVRVDLYLLLRQALFFYSIVMSAATVEIADALFCQSHFKEVVCVISLPTPFDSAADNG